MSAFQLRTFKDIVDAVCEELKVQSSDTVTRNRIKRDINMIYLNEVVPYAQFKWLRGFVDVVLKARIAAGTAEVTQHSRTVTLTVAPAYSVKGYWFSIEGRSERYQIAQHEPNSTTITLETAYTGNTASGQGYVIWTDRLPLPTDLKETIEVTQDYYSNPLEGCGLQKFRKISNLNPRAEGKPQYYTTGDYVNPDPYKTIANLPELETRASSGLVKTLKFKSNITSFLKAGDRIEVSNSSSSTYNGRFIVSSVSTNTLTYTGLELLSEAATSDTDLVIKKFTSTTDDERYRELWVYPAVTPSNITLHVDYLRKAAPLINDSDEPLMPVEDRIVLFYGALMKAWPRAGDAEEGMRNATLYDRKLQKMAGRLDDSTDMPILRPSRLYVTNKRKGFRFSQGTSAPALSGPSGATTITGTAGRVAIYDEDTGNLQASDSISVEELNKLDGIESEVVGVSDTQTLTNKEIDADKNTISNIGNNEIKEDANIEVRKLESLSPSRAIITDESGKLSTSEVTAEEIGYLAGVTSSIQDQLDNNAQDIDEVNEDLNIHTSDSSIHFEEGDIDHANIKNIGINSHTDIDNHIADSSIHTPVPSTKNSIELDAGEYQLVGDEDSPGPGKVYGTDSSGVKGWKDDPQSSSMNYISLPNGITSDFEGGSTKGWEVYANTTPAATPEVDPEGTPDSDVTFLASDTSPLRGGWSGVLSKDANNRQGHGIRTDEFTIDNADTQKALFVSFDYEVSSDFVAGDIQVFATDGTNILEVTNKSLRAGKQKFVGAFFATDSTSYRLIFHVASTNASAYTLKIDNVSVGPSDKLVSIQDTEELELDLTGSGDFTGGLLKFTRNGKIVTVDMLELVTHSANGNPSSASGLVPTRFRPETEARNTYSTTSTGPLNILIGTDGKISFFYYDYSGSPLGRTDAGTARSGALAYAIADANYQGIGQQTEIVGLSEVEPYQDYTSQIVLSDSTNVTVTEFIGHRVGPDFKFRGRLDWSGTGAGNNLRLSGLPYPVKGALPSIATVVGSGTAYTSFTVSASIPVSVETFLSDGTFYLRFIEKGNEIDGSQFSSGGILIFSGSYPVNEADAFSQIVPVTQIFFQKYGMSANNLNNNTEVSLGNIYLPSGTYRMEASNVMYVNYDTIPTRANGRIRLRKGTTVGGDAILDDNLSYNLVDQDGLSLQRGVSQLYGQFSWEGGYVNLTGSIAVTGGSGIVRSIPTSQMIFTRLGDA